MVRGVALPLGESNDNSICPRGKSRSGKLFVVSKAPGIKINAEDAAVGVN